MTQDHRPDSPENPFAGTGPVVLDIGGDVGAVIVTMPADLVGSEVDIVASDVDLDSATGTDDHDHDHGHGHGHGHAHGDGHGDRPHVAVVRRPLPDGRLVPTLVYPEVVEGRYRLLPKGTNDVVMEVDVVGGQVTEVTWPTVVRP